MITSKTAAGLAFLLASVWLFSFVHYRVAVEVWKNFKIEMPTLTIFGLQLIRAPFAFLIALAAITLAALVAAKERWARVVGLLFLLGLLVLNLGAFLPDIAIASSLSGGLDATPKPSAAPLIALTVAALFWNMFAIVAFALFLRREHTAFSRPVASAP